ncbi:MAG: c-type cytochrome domain-containing protein [Bacteroidota bacterium]
MKIIALCALLAAVPGAAAGEEPAPTDTAVSFREDVFPLVKKYCLPCHAEDNANPSDLHLDTYKSLKAGGRKGPGIVPGKPSESMFLQKMGEKPPFGGRMPLHSKRKIKEGKVRWLTPEEMDLLARWIRQGAKDN